MGFLTLLFFTMVLIAIGLFCFMGVGFAGGAMAQNHPGRFGWYLPVFYLLAFATILFICYLWVQFFLTESLPFQWTYLILPAGQIAHMILGAVAST